MGLVNYMAMNIIKLQHEVARVDYSNTKQEIFIRDFFGFCIFHGVCMQSIVGMKPHPPEGSLYQASKQAEILPADSVMWGFPQRIANSVS